MTRTGKVITLLTDFGLRDHFAGVMKGVIAGIAPRALVIDISHSVTPFEIDEARFLLAASWPYFPPGSIHVCVVDPGVGSARRALCVQAAGHIFLAPDNGLLTGVIAAGKARVRVITGIKYLLKNPSQTFHGRDVFAPAAAHLAAGVPPSRLGPPVRDAVRLDPLEPVRTGRRFWQGKVLHIDNFGNLVTNFPAAEFLPPAWRGVRAAAGFKQILRCAKFYAEADENEPFLIAGSAGYVEISLREGSAAKLLGVGVGAPVELEVW